MLELYHSGLTTCSKQVRLCLREKGLDYVSRYIELWKFENLHPDYLKLNPNGVVPTLLHDGRPIINSLVIMEYLEDCFPEVPLRPADNRARARMRLWTWTADDVHLSVMTATYMAFLKNHADEMTPEDIERMLAATPVPDRRERWRRTTHGGYSQQEIDDAFVKIAYFVGRMEDELADGPWLAGAAFSLADISMLSIIHRVGEIRPEVVAAKACPRIEDWWAQMKDRPAVAYVYSSPSDEVPGRPAGVSLEGLG